MIRIAVISMMIMFTPSLMHMPPLLALSRNLRSIINRLRIKLDLPLTNRFVFLPFPLLTLRTAVPRTLTRPTQHFPLHIVLTATLTSFPHDESNSRFSAEFFRFVG